MHLLLTLAVCFLKLIYAPIKLFPASHMVTFISRQSNAVNSDFQMLADAMRKKDPTLKVCFLCRTIGDGLLQKAGYIFHMFRQLYQISISEAVVLDSYCIAVSVLKHKDSLKVFQIWHALGSLKKFGCSILDMEEGSSRKTADILKMHRNYDYVFSSSEVSAPYFAEAFGTTIDKVVVNPLPRVDRITDEEWKRETRQRIADECPGLTEKPILLYAPTFRKNKDNVEPFRKIASAVDTSRYQLILAPHPNIRSQLTEIKNAIVLPQFSTIELAVLADFIITDYSALIYELAFLGKPIYYWMYDYDQYQSGRSFYTDYLNEAPGIKSSQLTDLLSAIDEGRSDLAENIKFAEKYVARKENCTDAMASFILNHMGSKL